MFKFITCIVCSSSLVLIPVYQAQADLEDLVDLEQLVDEGLESITEDGFDEATEAEQFDNNPWNDVPLSDLIYTDDELSFPEHPPEGNYWDIGYRGASLICCREIGSGSVQLHTGIDMDYAFDLDDWECQFDVDLSYVDEHIWCGVHYSYTKSLFGDEEDESALTLGLRINPSH